MNAASKIKAIHYAEREPLKGEKSAFTLCGVRVPVKETTTEQGRVTCFICFEKLPYKKQNA